LETLWRRGIPPKFRQKLWPFIVSNKLCLTKKLYTMNLQEGQNIVKKIIKNPKIDRKGLNYQILEKIEGDIAQTLSVLTDHNK